MSYIAGSVYYVKSKKNSKKTASSNLECDKVDIAKEAISEIGMKDHFSLKFGDGFRYLCCCMMLKKKRRSDQADESNEVNFQEAKDAFYQDFDII
mmetsp:Transcript_21723/g.20826  ORF Transcript_21723/g.20826 Transcript_21723/m.20826 type:complete len:95 (-) Transcript_21723:198-482(-)